MRTGWIYLLAAVAPAAAELNLVGDAVMIGDTIRLAPARNDKGGAAWRSRKVTLSHGFETGFGFRISNPGGLGKGADGLAFVIQNHGPAVIGAFGGAGGFAPGEGIYGGSSPGIPYSLAIFFDTFKNQEGDDPSNNYLAAVVHGHPDEIKWPPKRLALARKLPFNLKDGKPHHARIVFQPPVLSVFLDHGAKPILTAVADLSPILDANGQAYTGFTASTGGGWANHDVFDWDLRPAVDSTISVVSSNITFAPADCLPGRNLCTPAQAAVAEIGPGRFRITLPAHLAAGAGIPNPQSLDVAIENASGIVCSQTSAEALPSCGGPADRILIHSSPGRTTFAVRGASVAPELNQGFFEFEAALANPSALARPQ